MIEAIMETSLLVTVDLLSIQFVLYIAFISFVLFFIFRSYKKIKINQLKSPLMIFAIIGVLTYFIVENYRFNTFKSRLPYVFFSSIYEFFEEDELQLLPVNSDVISNSKDFNIIFILGESVRADHIQLNGYQRETNPILSKKENVLSYPNLYTPLTHTVASVKQLLTNQSINDSIKSHKIYSLFSLLNSINITTNWIGNSTIVKSYAPIILSNKMFY